MTIYDDYYTRYRAAIAAEIAKGAAADYQIKDFLWITFQFLQDRNTEPWEKEKMSKILKELQDKKEYKMIDAISKTIDLVLNR